MTALEAKRAPAKAGVYAAWLIDRAAFRELGVHYDGEPRPVYIGIATEKRALRTRLIQHSQKAFLDLAELLAARGRALFPWHHRNPGWGSGRFRPGPLCRLSFAQTVDWQQRNLRWSWYTCAPGRAAARESEAIRECEPLLNRQHAPPGPPQLRWSRGYSRARARWLWQIAWAGLNAEDRGWANLSAANIERWQFNDEGLNHRIDAMGYPLPTDLWQVEGARRIRLRRDWPEKERIYKLMKAAGAGAEPAVRTALAEPPSVRELQTWWSVHDAARFLPEPWAIEDSMASGLLMVDERSAPAPPRLPSPKLREALLLTEKALGRVRH